MTDQPAVLYSPLTGQAYFAGTPEYEAGFGPMGEELMPHPPEGYPEVAPPEAAAPAEPADPAAPASFEDEDVYAAEPAADEPTQEVAPAVDEPATLEDAPAADEPAAQQAPAADPFEDEFAALEDQYGDQVGEDETLESAGIDEAQYGIDPVDAPVSFDTTGTAAEEQGFDPNDKPAVLYSSLSGQAYGPGTPEYEDGFGPMGEELLAQPPADVTPVDGVDAVATEASAQDAPAGGFAMDDEYDEGYGAPPAAAETDATDHDAVQAEDAALEGLDDEQLEAGYPPEDTGEPSLERPANVPTVQLPSPGAYVQPAEVTLYVNKQPVMTHSIQTDETLIGRQDVRSDVYPDIDLTAHDPEGFVSRKHAYIYRQNKNYTLYAVSNGGVQVNTTLLDLGDREALKDGDVIVIAGFLAFKFNLPEQ